jgi:hypothetical protein
MSMMLLAATEQDIVAVGLGCPSATTILSKTLLVRTATAAAALTAAANNHQWSGRMRPRNRVLTGKLFGERRHGKWKRSYRSIRVCATRECRRSWLRTSPLHMNLHACPFRVVDL